jgi:hypothetical protein
MQDVDSPSSSGVVGSNSTSDNALGTKGIAVGKDSGRWEIVDVA